MDAERQEAKAASLDETQRRVEARKGENRSSERVWTATVEEADGG